MNLHKPTLISIAFLTNVTLMGAVLAVGLRHADPTEPPGQDKSLKEQLHGVLSSARLTPPLRGMPHQVRFSSNGEYLVVQLESGIYILNRRPLEIQTWIYAPDILPARFSADSKTLILATRSLAITRWNLADNRRVDRTILKKRDGCLASELSPHGDLAACLDPSLVLELYRTDTGERILGQQIFTEQERLAAGIVSTGLIPRNEGTAYAEPFGYSFFDTLEDLADREIFGARFLFSPDSHFILMLDRAHRTAVCVDVNARRKFRCPGIIKDHWNATICFVAPNQIAVLDPDNPEKSQILEFPGGQFANKLDVAARIATPATQSNYLIVGGRDKWNEVRLFDWHAGRTLKPQEDAQLDVTGETLAAYSRQGELKLVHVAEDALEAQTVLPAPLLPSLRVANASPTLDTLVLGVRGDAALFRADTGNQIMAFRRLTGAWFAGDDKLYIAESRQDGLPAPIKEVNPNRETTTDTWSPTFKSDPQFTILNTHTGGPVLFVLEQSSVYVFPDGHTDSPGHQSMHKLRALDMKTGRELWLRQWVHHTPVAVGGEGVGQFPVRTWYDPPIPYADPQGDRVAIGWRAMTSGGQSLAKRYPALKRQMDATKLTLNDAVFEVLEAASGKSVGTALVRVGFGPESFDTVFSIGDFLICVRDGARVTVYSLSTGEIQARLYGQYISASAASGLLAAADGNHLRLYNLKNGSKIDEYPFPDAPVYTRFSTAGNRLLVLTAQQVAYVIAVDALSSPAGDRDHASRSLDLRIATY
jgi:hypothetical protein